MNGVYVGSRADEVALMLREIMAGTDDALSHLAAPPADTRGAEAVDALDDAAGEVGEVTATKRADRDAVEHRRQSRLRSYQRLP